MAKILLTGAAGFIGFHTAVKMAAEGEEVIALDSINSYYDVSLKISRLKELGIDASEDMAWNTEKASSKYPSLTFRRLQMADREAMFDLFSMEKIEVVVHLAAQPGVRYSREHPEAYVESNLVGFCNLLDCCVKHDIKHLVFASSSSVYGDNRQLPFATPQRTDTPISFYAATKKCNEIMAYSYSHMHKLRTTGLRFFTAYGPWGRPDMALFKFTRAILDNMPIELYNNGNMARDFTYVEDISHGISLVAKSPAFSGDETPYRIYNVGHGKAVRLMDFVKAIEKWTGREALKTMRPMQAGDLPSTWADISDFERDFGYAPQTNVEEGVKRFVEWYRVFYKI